LVHSPLIGELLHLVQRGGAWAGWALASPLLAVPNITAHPSTASVPTSYYSMCHYAFALQRVDTAFCCTGRRRYSDTTIIRSNCYIVLNAALLCEVRTRTAIMLITTTLASQYYALQ